VSGSGDFFSSNGGGVVKNGSGLNGGGVGISDFVSNLYHQQPHVSSVNGSVSMSNVDPLNSSVDGAMKLNANDLN
ncbi:nucleolar GTPase, partial [Trifolium medium]|nr:nucleolar GTPase [Trifolium medium]